MRVWLGSGIVLFGAAAVVASASDKTERSPYSGQQHRSIKSLSADDIAALKSGAGWGFAKAAELNGYPGPLHVLELANQLQLNAKQRRQIEAIFARMKSSARELGAQFLAAEQALDRAFTDRSVTAKRLSMLTTTAGTLRARLRAVHLTAHLETAPLLTEHQRQRYAMLRGYQGGHHAPDGPHKHHAHPK